MKIWELGTIIFAMSGLVGVAQAGDDLSVRMRITENGREIYLDTLHLAKGEPASLSVGRDITYTAESKNEQNVGGAGETVTAETDSIFDGFKITVTALDVKLPASYVVSDWDTLKRTLGSDLLNVEVQFTKLLQMRSATVAGGSIELPEMDRFRKAQAFRMQPGESKVVEGRVAGRSYQVSLTTIAATE